MSIKSIESELENKVGAATIKAAVKIAKKICELYPKIHAVQPHITGIHTGMGSWSFNGKGIGICNEEGEVGKLWDIEDVSLADMIENGHAEWFDLPVNKSLTEIVKLLNYLVFDLNCSTWQNMFTEKGVVFVYGTQESQNPFSTPHKSYFLSDPYYKALVKAGVPVYFELDKEV